MAWIALNGKTPYLYWRQGGKTKYLSLAGKSEPEQAILKSEVETLILKKTPAIMVPGTITLEKGFDEFERHIENHRKPNTLRFYSSKLKQIRKFFPLKQQIGATTIEQLEAFLQMKFRGKKGGLSPITMNGWIRCFRAIWHWWLKRHWASADRDPTSGLDCYREDLVVPKKPITRDRYVALIETVRKDQIIEYNRETGIGRVFYVLQDATNGLTAAEIVDRFFELGMERASRSVVRDLGALCRAKVAVRTGEQRKGLFFRKKGADPHQVSGWVYKIDQEALRMRDARGFYIRRLFCDICDNLWAYGLRIGEFADLKRVDVDWEAQVFTIHASKNKGGDRVLPIQPEVKETFWHYYSMGREYVFANYDGKNARKALDEFRKRLVRRFPEIKEATNFHAFRHAMATRLADAGVDPHTRSRELLGHATIQMTGNYTHQAIHTKLAAYEKLRQHEAKKGG